jgi:hypothetical protein
LSIGMKADRGQRPDAVPAGPRARGRVSLGAGGRRRRLMVACERDLTSIRRRFVLASSDCPVAGPGLSQKA